MQGERRQAHLGGAQAGSGERDRDEEAAQCAAGQSRTARGGRFARAPICSREWGPHEQPHAEHRLGADEQQCHGARADRDHPDSYTHLKLATPYPL